jgi:hypothetical protein
MPASTRRSVARLAAAILLVVLAGGCAGEDATSTAVSQATTTSTTVAPTTTRPKPLTAGERAWLDAIPKVRARIDNALTETVTLTPLKLRSLANTLRSCRRQLLGAGSLGERLRPIYDLVKEACREYDKGARCFATAARMSATILSAAEQRKLHQAFDCGFAAQGKGLYPLGKAEQQASQLKAAGG